MPKISFKQANGITRELEIPVDSTLMEAAVSNDVEGIVGECGGTMACGTCHCFIDNSWLDKTGTPCEMEEQVLEYSNVDARPNSRLGCQVRISQALDGLVVELPESQY